MLLYTHRRLLGWLHDLGASGAGTEIERAERAFVSHLDDRRAWEALDAARLLASIDVGLPLVIGEIRRRNLIRWDAVSSVWEGERIGGGRGLVRVLRPEAARDPVLRRALTVEMGALVSMLPALRPAEDARAGVVAWSLPVASTASEWPALPIRLQLGWMLALQGWRDAGLLPWRPTMNELVVDGDGVPRVASMGVGRGGAFDDVARHLARTLNRAAQVPEPAGTEVAALLRAWTEIGPSDAVELEHQLVAHLRLDLASAWHGIRRRAERASLMSVVGRYREAVSRLSRAVPRPRARGPIGVDVDGELVEVVSDGAGVRWGQAAQVVWVDGEGLRAAEARRLLRAMSSGGAVRSALGTADDGVEQLGRWLGCEFQLRTLA